MAGTTPETLAFFAPGLLHQFGNLWLSIDGQASLLDARSADQIERTRTAILGATRDGRACLEVMRFLAGEPATAPRPLRRVLDDLVAVARVPLRERHHTIEHKTADAHGETPVDAADVVVMTAEAIRQLVGSLPAGAQGTVAVGGALAVDGATQIDVWFEAAPGTLPFPCGGEALRDLASLAATRASMVACARRRAGLSLQFRARPRAMQPGSFR